MRVKLFEKMYDSVIYGIGKQYFSPKKYERIPFPKKYELAFLRWFLSDHTFSKKERFNNFLDVEMSNVTFEMAQLMITFITQWKPPRSC